MPTAWVWRNPRVRRAEDASERAGEGYARAGVDLPTATWVKQASQSVLD